jgi:hypothetical protein
VPSPAAVVETRPPEPALVDDVTSPGARDWLRFRGPGMDGRYEAAEVPTGVACGWASSSLKQPVGGGYGRS